MNIIFFDGFCGLCNRFIDFLLRFDQKKRLFYSPLQGKTIQKTEACLLKDKGTLVFLYEGKIVIKSTAVLKAIACLGFYWKVILLFLLVPRCIRDKIYDCIASHRYQWFGMKKTCRVPTEEEKSRFLE